MARKDEKAESAGVSTEEMEESADEAEGAAESEPEAQEGDAEEQSDAGEQAEEEAPREKKKKKVVRRRKTKKERENPMTTAVRLAVESGKVEFGAKAGIASSILGKAKLFVVASNTPPETKERLEAYAKASKIPLVEFEGSTMELGSVCGKPFPVSVLSVYEEGTSNIMDLAKKK
jgi:large subunit ribosomal protein L30e